MTIKLSQNQRELLDAQILSLVRSHPGETRTSLAGRACGTLSFPGSKWVLAAQWERLVKLSLQRLRSAGDIYHARDTGWQPARREG